MIYSQIITFYNGLCNRTDKKTYISIHMINYVIMSCNQSSELVHLIQTTLLSLK